MDNEKQNFTLAKKEESGIDLMRKIILGKGQTVRAQEDYKDVIDIKKQARELRLKVEKLVNPFIKIQKKAYDDAKDEANKYLVPLKEIEKQARGLITEYECWDQERITREILEKSKGNIPAENQIEINEELSSTAGIRKAWKAEVVDMSKVPEKYIIKTVDLVALNKIARETGGAEKVDGIEFKLC